MAIPKVFGQIPGLGKMGQAVKAGAESFSKEWQAGYKSMSKEEQDYMWDGIALSGVALGTYEATKSD